MRAKEFVINVPITVSINGDDDVQVSAPNSDQHTDDTEHAMVPPLQQTIELQKAAGGKHSEVIDDLTADEEPDCEPVIIATSTEPQDPVAYTVNHSATPPW